MTTRAHLLCDCDYDCYQKRMHCSSCQKDVQTLSIDNGPICCEECGKVLDDNMFDTSVTFFKDSTGVSHAGGNIINNEPRESLRLGVAKEQMWFTSQNLNIGLEVFNIAWKLYTLVFERELTRGHRTDQMQAACLYIACRQKKKPYLLIDFSNHLRINIYVLGAVFLWLCKKLYLGDPTHLRELVDPSLFISKFTDSLLSNKEDQKTRLAVSKTAESIITSMKHDWITTGRKPSGLCGAALYISALSHGIKCSKSDVVKTVHICEATLLKRLDEFENTESGSLTALSLLYSFSQLIKLGPSPDINLHSLKVEEVMGNATELGKCSTTNQANVGSKDKHEVVCQHTDREPYACRVCKDCYDELLQVLQLSGGLAGGLDPPAFQRAEKLRMSTVLMEKNSVESTVSSEKFSCSKQIEKGFDIPDKSSCENSLPTELEAENGKYAEDEPTVGDDDDESDNFSDIDDNEVDGYLHNEEEKQYKKIIWEDLNREYLEEQAEKEAIAAAAKKAYEESMENCPEAARDLIAATKAALEKSRKEKRLKRAAEAKNAVPAKTAIEATCQLLNKKRLSAKVNHDLLKKMFEESEDQEENPKKLKTGSDLENDGKTSITENEERALDEEDPRVNSYYDDQDEGYDANNFNDMDYNEELDAVW